MYCIEFLRTISSNDDDNGGVRFCYEIILVA